MESQDKKIVIFGAGKIGRSFIGQVFSNSGYEVIFVDINKELIRSLNKKKQYNIIVKTNEGNETIPVTNVRGISLDETEKIVRELASASIAALSVGQKGLALTIPLIAEALQFRMQKHGEWPLDIIIAENMRNADIYIANELSKHLPADFSLNTMVGLIETSIGKMVPIMTQKDLEDDPLQLFAEPYNSLILAKHGFRNPIPEIPYLAPKDTIKAWVDRKLFIHNLGHAASAYLGNQKYPDAQYIWEVLSDSEIFEATRAAMIQSADILRALYPEEFTQLQLTTHVDDLLKRFQNKALGDTVFRVGCDLFRKLSPEDRLIAPLNAGLILHMPIDKILKVVIAALGFNAKDENGKYFPEDELFYIEAAKGIEHVLRGVCGLRFLLDYTN